MQRLSEEAGAHVLIEIDYTMMQTLTILMLAYTNESIISAMAQQAKGAVEFVEVWIMRGLSVWDIKMAHMKIEVEHFFVTLTKQMQVVHSYALLPERCCDRGGDQIRDCRVEILSGGEQFIMNLKWKHAAAMSFPPRPCPS